jgi:MATE family multidrug resistance protein
VVIATAVANVLHVVLSYALMFGRLGAPALGVEGSAYAMAASRWSMFLVLLWAGWPELKSTLRPWRDRAWEWAPMRRMLGLGAPLAAQYFFEAFAFGLVTIWAGWLGMTTLAGHEIALNLASVTFMVPLGVSGAGAALVGNAVGRGDQDGVRREAAAVLVLGVGFMGASALAFVLAPAFFAGLYTNDATTLAVALSLLPIAGAFQLFDGLQVVCGAILRGTGETRTPMLMHFLGFWGAGVPTSWWLGLHAGWGARGLWWGLVAGLVFAGALQFSRVIVRLKGPIARLNIDHAPLGH